MKKLWLVGFAVAAVCAAVSCVLCLVHGACGGMLDCGTVQVPMKCFWAYRAAALCSGLSAVAAIAGMAAKAPSARRVAALLCALCAAAVVLLLYVVIGVCAKEGMACIANRIPVTVLCVVGVVAAAVAAVKADDAKADLPKAQL